VIAAGPPGAAEGRRLPPGAAAPDTGAPGVGATPPTPVVPLDGTVAPVAGAVDTPPVVPGVVPLAPLCSIFRSFDAGVPASFVSASGAEPWPTHSTWAWL
jgi:hypothetical protein